MRKIRISNDSGNPMMTRITDAVSGETYDHVVGADIQPIRVDQRGPIRAILDMYVEQIDITVEADFRYQCPYCGTHLGG